MRVCTVIIAAGLFMIGAVAAASGNKALSEPQQVVENVSEGLKSVLRKDRQRLRNDPRYVYEVVDRLFLPNVDVNGVSALVLGRHWRGATPQQRQAFNREFKELIIQTYATALNEISVDGWDMTYLPTRELKGKIRRVVVRTQILRPGNTPVSVDYSMRQDGKRWLAYDVAVEGVSLLTNYRSSFTRLASQKGLDGLIRELAARNDSRRRTS
jgi:phospholipid transport system substrate-binding protein